MFDEAPDVLRGLAEEMADYRNFGVCLDYAHAVISGTKTEVWMKELAPYIKHMHINDNDLKNDLHQAIGTGTIDWKKFSEEMEKYKICASAWFSLSKQCAALFRKVPHAASVFFTSFRQRRFPSG